MSSSHRNEPSWHLLESDPGVFSELLVELGVKHVDVEELWSVDDLVSKSEENTCGVIFLFKWQGRRSRAITQQQSSDDDKVVFIKQVVENACGTIALLHVLLNRDGVEIGETLEGLKGFIKDMDGETAGSCLASHEGVRMAHNAFVRPEAFSIEEDPRRGKSDDAFHFVAYVPKNGRVYELDGLSARPIVVGDCGPNWLNSAQDALQKRISEYSQLEIRFNLLIVKKSTLYLTLKEAA
jgi:ubiquitin carboxyl-terminal hydrolase L5